MAVSVGPRPVERAERPRRVIPGVTGPAAPRHARWVRRAGAALVDLLIYGTVSGIMTGIGWAIFLSSCEGTVDTKNLVCLGDDPSPFANVFLIAAYVVPVVAVLLNAVVLQGLRGYSLGKAAFGLRVVQGSSGAVMGFWVSFSRLVLLIVLTVVTLGVNLILPIWDRERPTLHDQVLGTAVIRND